MPPKTKITKEKILSAAFETAQKEGYEKINARSVSQKLNCSTQPILYHFSNMEELKKETYKKADEYHTNYLMKVKEDSQNPLLEIGLNYVRFAKKEPHLFRFIFQSGYIEQKNILEMMDSNDLAGIFKSIEQEAGLSSKEAKNVFMTLAMFVHGYASLIANNGLDYEEDSLSKQLKKLFIGAYLAERENNNE